MISRVAWDKGCSQTFIFNMGLDLCFLREELSQIEF